MKKNVIAALLLGAALLPALQGCFPVVAAGATTGVMAAIPGKQSAWRSKAIPGKDSSSASQMP